MIIRSIILFFSCCVSLFSQEVIGDNVDRMLRKIVNEQDFNQRVSYAEELAKYVGSLEKSEVNAVSCLSIEAINKALASERAPVRARLARVVGAIGPRASGALPALRKALEEELSPPGIGPLDPLPSWDDSKVYRAAIEMIEMPTDSANRCD